MNSCYEVHYCFKIVANHTMLLHAHCNVQGCGHIRHMMEEPEEYGLEGEYEAGVSAVLIRSFFTFGWRITNGKWDARSKLYLPILQGALKGNATVIINKADKASCPGLYPEVGRAHGGSQLFIYHADVSRLFIYIYTDIYI